MVEFITIKSILDKYIFDDNAVIYLSDNRKFQNYQEYPYLIVRNGKDKNGNINNLIDSNLFLYDKAELKKLITPIKENKETFHEKLVNNIVAYKGNESIADEMRMELILAWKTMFNQLRLMVDPLLAKGGLVATPNPEYFLNMFNADNPDYTKIREEFYFVLKQCIVNNYIESETINKTILNEEEKVKCAKEYTAYLAKLARMETLKLNQ